MGEHFGRALAAIDMHDPDERKDRIPMPAHCRIPPSRLIVIVGQNR